MEWWRSAYTSGENALFRKRFYIEAGGTLVIKNDRFPVEKDPALPLEQIFEALSFKRLSLKADQGIEEWDGPG